MCKLNYSLFLLLGYMVVFSCKNDSESVQVNSFSMVLNNRLWKPSQIKNDKCYQTYTCEWSAYNQKPIYTINAFKDPESKADGGSQNVFQLQIIGVSDTGLYNINEPYDLFTSYARFIISEPGSKKIYGNSVTKTTSWATIDEMLPTKGSTLVGIKGCFSGILYNDKDPKDSIIIKDCRFTLKRINWGDFCQCEN